MGLLPKLRPSTATAKVASRRDGHASKRASTDISANELAPATTTTTTPATARKTTRSTNSNASNNLNATTHSIRNIKLTAEAQQLKDAIVAAHAGVQPFVRFSFRRMRHCATPPVQLPENVADKRARSAYVAGHKVPFTRGMHDNAQRRFKRRQLDVIDEYCQY